MKQEIKLGTTGTCKIRNGYKLAGTTRKFVVTYAEFPYAEVSVQVEGEPETDYLVGFNFEDGKVFAAGYATSYSTKYKYFKFDK